MRANEFITEGPISAIKNKMADMSRNKKAKQLAKRQAKDLPKLSKAVQKKLAEIVDQVLIKSMASGNDVDEEKLSDTIGAALEQLVRIDIQPDTELGNAAEDILDGIMHDPKTVATNPKVSQGITDLLSIASGQDASKAPAQKLKSSTATMVTDNGRYYLKYKGNSRWVEYTKDGDEYSYVGDITKKIRHDELNALAQTGRTPVNATSTPAADDRNITIDALPGI